MYPEHEKMWQSLYRMRKATGENWVISFIDAILESLYLPAYYKIKLMSVKN
jgi:hypothetical protein